MHAQIIFPRSHLLLRQAWKCLLLRCLVWRISSRTWVADRVPGLHSGRCLWRRQPGGLEPLVQHRACSILNLELQTNSLGRLGGGQWYLRQSASRKAPLHRLNPCLVIGSAINELYAPFHCQVLLLSLMVGVVQTLAQFRLQRVFCVFQLWDFSWWLVAPVEHLLNHCSVAL